MFPTQDMLGLAVILPAVVAAAARSADHNGPSADALEVGDGQMALVLTGTASATAVVKVEESDDASTWSDVASPAVSGIATQQPINVPITASETVFSANFTKSKRYIRCVITGTGHRLAGVFIGKKKYTGS